MKKFSESYLDLLEGSGVDFNDNEDVTEEEANSLLLNFTKNNSFILAPTSDNQLNNSTTNTQPNINEQNNHTSHLPLSSLNDDNYHTETSQLFYTTNEEFTSHEIDSSNDSSNDSFIDSSVDLTEQEEDIQTRGRSGHRNPHHTPLLHSSPPSLHPTPTDNTTSPTSNIHYDINKNDMNNNNNNDNNNNNNNDEISGGSGMSTLDNLTASLLDIYAAFGPDNNNNNNNNSNNNNSNNHPEKSEQTVVIVKRKSKKNPTLREKQKPIAFKRRTSLNSLSAKPLLNSNPFPTLNPTSSSSSSSSSSTTSPPQPSPSNVLLSPVQSRAVKSNSPYSSPNISSDPHSHSSVKHLSNDNHPNINNIYNNNNNNINNNNIYNNNNNDNDFPFSNVTSLPLPDLSPKAISSPPTNPVSYKSKYVNNILNNNNNIVNQIYVNSPIILSQPPTPPTVQFNQKKSDNPYKYLFKGWMYWKDNLFVPTRSNIQSDNLSIPHSNSSNDLSSNSQQNSSSNQPSDNNNNNNNNNNNINNNPQINANGFEKRFIVMTKRFIFFFTKNVENMEEHNKKYLTKTINLTKYYFKEVFQSFELYSNKFNEFYIFQPENLVDYQRWVDAFHLTISKIISRPKNLLTGWMMKGKIKYGKPRFWKKRWFILEFGSISLRYFTKIPECWLDDRDLKGKIIFVDVILSDLPNSMISNATGFGVLLKSKAASWCFSFDTLQAKEKFKSCVKKVIDTANNLLQLSNFRRWVYYSPSLPYSSSLKSSKETISNEKKDNNNNNNNNNLVNNIENTKALVLLTHYSLVFFKGLDPQLHNANNNSKQLIPDLSTVFDTICIIGGDVFRTSAADTGKHRFCFKDFAKFSHFISCDTSADVKEWIEVLRNSIISHSNQNLGYNCNRVSKFLRNVVDLSNDPLKNNNKNNNNKNNNNINNNNNNNNKKVVVTIRGEVREKAANNNTNRGRSPSFDDKPKMEDEESRDVVVVKKRVVIPIKPLILLLILPSLII